MTTPLISVVMPVYNSEKFLENAISSVLSQSFGDFELICIDDCSKDASGEILETFAKLDTRVVVRHLAKNVGEGNARNCGIKLAQGVYIMSCDSDDSLPVDSLRHLYEAIRKHDSDAVIGSLQYMSEDGAITSAFQVSREEVNIDIFHSGSLMIHFLGYHTCILFKKTFVDRYVAPYGENVATSADAHLLFRIMFDLKKVTLLRDIVYNYRYNVSSNVHSSHSYQWHIDNLFAYKILYESAQRYEAFGIADERFFYELGDMLPLAARDLTKKEFSSFVAALKFFLIEYEMEKRCFLEKPSFSDRGKLYSWLIFLFIIGDNDKLLYLAVKFKKILLLVLRSKAICIFFAGIIARLN